MISEIVPVVRPLVPRLLRNPSVRAPVAPPLLGAPCLPNVSDDLTRRWPAAPLEPAPAARPLSALPRLVAVAIQVLQELDG